MEARNLPATTNGVVAQWARDVAGRFDLDALHHRAVMHYHGGDRSAWLDDETTADLAAAAAPIVARVYEVAFILAAAWYVPSKGKRYSPSRMQAIDRLDHEIGVNRRDAYRACEMVDGVLELTIGEGTGIPTIQHLNVIVRSDLGRSGWGMANAEAVRRGGWGNFSHDHLRHFLAEQAKAANDAQSERDAAVEPEPPAAVRRPARGGSRRRRRRSTRRCARGSRAA